MGPLPPHLLRGWLRYTARGGLRLRLALRLGSDGSDGECVLHLEHGLMQSCDGRKALVFGALGVEECDEHVSVAFAFGVVCA